MKISIKIATSLIIVNLFGLPACASVNSPALIHSQQDNSRFKANMEKAGVEKSKQETLIKNFNQGIMPESVTQKTRPDSIKHDQENGYNITKNIYPDGSVLKTGVQLVTPNTSKKVKSISECTVQPGAGTWVFSNCRSFQENLIITAEFRADGRISNIGNAAITRIYGYRYEGDGTFSNPRLEVIHPTQIGDIAAQGRFSFEWSVGLYTKTVTLDIYAKENVWDDWS